MAEHHWTCPNCDYTHVTHEPEPHTPFHPCRGVLGMLSPMVPGRTRCKIIAVEREDWVGREEVQVNAEGRPIMALVTVRDDGQDCTVFAPLATGALHGLE